MVVCNITSRRQLCESQGCNQPTIATLYQNNLRGFLSTRFGEFWFQIVWQELRMSMAKEMEALKVTWGVRGGWRESFGNLCELCVYTYLKFNSKNSEKLPKPNRKGSSTFPIIFQGRTVKLRGCKWFGGKLCLMRIRLWRFLLDGWVRLFDWT